jgi:hypothetical protein
MSAISLFQEKQVRRAWNASEQKWYFSIDDVVLALTDSANVKDYIKKLRKRDPELDFYWGTNCPPVEMAGADGKKRPIKAANTPKASRKTKTPPTPAAPSPATPAKPSKPRAATKSPPQKITKLSPNPRNASPAKNPDRLQSQISHLKSQILNGISSLRTHSS